MFSNIDVLQSYVDAPDVVLDKATLPPPLPPFTLLLLFVLSEVPEKHEDDAKEHGDGDDVEFNNDTCGTFEALMTEEAPVAN